MVARFHGVVVALVSLWLLHAEPSASPAQVEEYLPPFLPAPSAPSARSNQQVAETIAALLKESGRLHLYHVNIRFDSGLVELSGQVSDPHQRAELLRLVQSVPEVTRVADHLMVIKTNSIITVQAADGALPETGPMPNRLGDNPLNGPAAPNNGVMEPTPIFQAPPGPNATYQPPPMPPYAWPTYAPYNNYSRVAYPTLYPNEAWPFIGPFNPFPKVPLGWRGVSLRWQDGYWWYGKDATGHDWWRIRYW